MRKTTSIILLFTSVFLSGLKLQAQDDGKILIDQVVAIVGGNVILYSDIENEYQQFLMQGNTKGRDAKCMILEELLFQKLLLTQAEIDSVVVTEKQVESEIDRRMRYFIAQIGSKEKLEEYFGKSMLEIKEDLRDRIRDYLVIQNVQQKITQDIRITPSEVSDFFNGIPADSLPLIGSEIEIVQIVKKPVVGQDEINQVKERLIALRNRSLNGEDFAVLANLYSEDPGSMSKGGEVGFAGRGELFPEFEAAAFALKPGEISPVVKTEKGYHIIQMIERRGEFINVRHILMIPKPSMPDLLKAKKDLDNILSLISMDSVTFEEAARLYSDDPSKINGGNLINEYSGNTKFTPDEIEPTLFFTIDKMNPCDVSAPLLYNDKDGIQTYRLVKLKSRTQPHQANLKDDYPQIQNMALTLKQNEAINKWIVEKSQKTFIKISDQFKTCNLRYNWKTY